MYVSTKFESGNVEVLDTSDPSRIRLAIRPDANCEFLQWFYFRLTGARGTDCTMLIENAGAIGHDGGWDDYRAVASYNRKTWFRVPTEYDGSVLAIRHRPERDAIYYAYFAPYSLERHHDFIAQCLASPRARLEVLGRTLDGHDLDLLRIGEATDDKPVCWIVARQHPDETQGAWWMEGFLERLLDEGDPVAREVLQRAVIYAVPNVNPDGTQRGNGRSNAAGANLHVEWPNPSMERCPEVYLARQRMEATGVDFFFDVHAGKLQPHAFISSSDRLPSLNERQIRLRGAFDAALSRANPDFLTEYAYPRIDPRKVQPDLCSSWVAERFGCLALTLEMPSKDNAAAPDERAGWSPERSRRLGAATLDALYVIVEGLR